MIRRDDLLIGPKDRAIAAVKAGNQEEAIKNIEELAVEGKPTHDRFAEWIQNLLTFIADEMGEEAVEKATKRTWEDVYKKKMMSSGWRAPDLTAEELVRFWIRGHRCHYSDFYIEEDDEKFVMVIPFCGSGGRLHDEDKPGKTSKAYPWSFDQAGVSYFCAHEPVFESEKAKMGLEPEIHKYETVYDENNKPVGHRCQYIVYKKPGEK